MWSVAVVKNHRSCRSLLRKGRDQERKNDFFDTSFWYFLHARYCDERSFLWQFLISCAKRYFFTESILVFTCLNVTKYTSHNISKWIKTFVFSNPRFLSYLNFFNESLIAGRFSFYCERFYFWFLLAFHGTNREPQR